MGVDLSAFVDLSDPPDTQGRIMAKHHSAIRRSLQVDAVYPHLNEQGLLSDHEKEILLNPYHTRQYKTDRILQWIPRKGSGALDRFIECLRRSSREARGHGELADELQRGVDRDRDHPDPDNWLRIPAPDSPTIKSKSLV